MEYPELLALLARLKPYIQKIHDDAECRHDTYGDDYMSAALFEVMEDTGGLLGEIDRALAVDTG